jgi:antitoxin component of RelBE/YafQ-DinJ toxin-antitoxin module
MKKDINENYKSARIKNDTYKNLKLLAIELGMPMTQVIDLIYDEFIKNQKQKADAD